MFGSWIAWAGLLRLCPGWCGVCLQLKPNQTTTKFRSRTHIYSSQPYFSSEEKKLNRNLPVLTRFTFLVNRTFARRLHPNQLDAEMPNYESDVTEKAQHIKSTCYWTSTHRSITRCRIHSCTASSFPIFLPRTKWVKHLADWAAPEAIVGFAEKKDHIINC